MWCDWTTLNHESWGKIVRVHGGTSNQYCEMKLWNKQNSFKSLIGWVESGTFAEHIQIGEKWAWYAQQCDILGTLHVNLRFDSIWTKWITCTKSVKARFLRPTKGATVPEIFQVKHPFPMPSRLDGPVHTHGKNRLSHHHQRLKRNDPLQNGLAGFVIECSWVIRLVRQGRHKNSYNHSGIVNHES